MAKTTIRLEIEDERLRRRLEEVAEKGKRPRDLFVRIHADQRTKSRTMFRKLRRGGTFRQVTWPWYQDQYTRKTDGVTVPAEGGVPKVRGEGVVLGTAASRLAREHVRVSNLLSGVLMLGMGAMIGIDALITL